MSVICKTRTALATALSASALLFGTLPGCSVFASHGPSTVAQGKYYASGEPYYDEFFIALYMSQLGMGEAPRVPETERRNLLQILKLPPETPAAEIEHPLREEALKLSRAGVHLRLDQRLSANPEMASVELRSNARPKENPSAALLAQVETSATNLLRSSGEMKAGEAALGKLEVMTITLDASVERAFAQSHFGKQAEVKKNLADAHRLIALMRARAGEVRGASEQLLSVLSKAVNTDDGSLGPAGGEAPSEPAVEAGKPDSAKKPTAKPAHPKLAPATHAKPAPAADGDTPAKPPAAASKPGPAPRDFEP